MATVVGRKSSSGPEFLTVVVKGGAVVAKYAGLAVIAF